MSFESVDAELQNLQQENTNGVKPCNVVLSKPTEERVYDTSHEIRGNAMIFNHTEYIKSLDLSERQSSMKDVEVLMKTLPIFGVKPDVHNNLTVKGIQELIYEGNYKMQLLYIMKISKNLILQLQKKTTQTEAA